MDTCLIEHKARTVSASFSSFSIVSSSSSLSSFGVKKPSESNVEQWHEDQNFKPYTNCMFFLMCGCTTHTSMCLGALQCRFSGCFTGESLHKPF